MPNSLKLCHVILQNQELHPRLTLTSHRKVAFKITEYEFFKKRYGSVDFMLMNF